MENYSGIIERIKDRRTELKMSYQDLSDKTGISKSTLQRYETGHIKNIPLGRINDLANALGVTQSYILGIEEAAPVASPVMVPILGTVKGGYDYCAQEDFMGYEPTYDLKNPNEYIWLIVTGNSMEPDIKEGDYALVRRQNDVDNGDIAVVILNGEEGTVKKINKHHNAISLVPLNPRYETRVFVGEEMNSIMIYGKVVETKRKY